MIKIEIQNAENGIIKKVIDTQYNGADQSAEIIFLYEIEEEDPVQKYLKTIQFINDLMKDLAIDTGSDYSSIRLDFELKWGDKYNPSLEEVTDHIKNLNQELKSWREYKRVIESKPNAYSV
jgi:hypothetical protein